MNEFSEVPNKKDIVPQKEYEIREQLGGINLITLHKKNSATEIRTALGDEVSPDETIFALDFYIEQDPENPPEEIVDKQTNRIIGFNFKDQNIINIDHHADHKDMTRHVSTANQVLAYAKQEGLPKNPKVVVNHFDADSALSAGMLDGQIPIEDGFGEAAIAADHTGGKNEFGDLLSSIDNPPRLKYSMDRLHDLMDGNLTDDEATKSIQERDAQRERAKELVEKGRFQDMGNGVVYAQLRTDEPAIRPVLLPGLMPDAELIILSSELDNKKDGSKTWDMKVRAGQSLVDGVTLHDLDNFDEEDGVTKYLGGRWGAKGTSRYTNEDGTKGYPGDPKEFAKNVSDLYKKAKENKNHR